MMRRGHGILWAIGAVQLAAWGGVAMTGAAPAPRLPAELVRAAVESPPPRWKFDGRRHAAEMRAVFALQFLAVAAHETPTWVVAERALAEHLVEKLRFFLVTPEGDADGATREPQAHGGIGGWTHNAAAQSLLLARRTPEVWARLTAAERGRADTLMQALAVAGHYSLDDENDFYLLIDGRSHYHRSWNPNHVAGYVGVMVAASLYFGAEELNTFFERFDFDAFTARLDALNFQNIRRVWTAEPAMRALLMEGGAIALGEHAVLAQGVYSSGAGVRNRFTYDGIPLDQPWRLYRAQAVRLYAKAVRTRVTVHGDNASYLLNRASDAQVSPWEGQMGMCHEFESTDWDGLRTSAGYAYEGVMIDLGIATALKVLGEWRPEDGGEMVERRMGVGMADLRFKLTEGYRGWSTGRERLTWWEKDVEPIGGAYTFALWETYFAPPPAPRPPRDAGR